jgi:hypothetical protein
MEIWARKILVIGRVFIWGALLGFNFLNLAQANAISTPSPRKTVHLLFMDNSASSESYITSNQEAQMLQSIKMAVSDVQNDIPNCTVKQVTMFGRNDPLFIFKQKEIIEKNYSPESTIIVGLKNSGETNLAAEAFKSTNYLALSSGVSSDDLGRKNAHFFSMANRIRNYTKAVGEFISKRHLEHSTMIIYPGGNFAQTFTEELAGQFAEVLPKYQVDSEKIALPSEAEEKIRSGSVKMIALPVGDIQQAMPFINFLKQLGYEGDIVGSSNWGRAMNDMNRFVHSINLGKTQIYFPNSWSEGESIRSKDFEHDFKAERGGEAPTGTAVYTYDAALMAAQYLCEAAKPSAASFRQYLMSLKDHRIRTVRNYIGLENNNVASSLRMVHFDSENLRMETIK